MEEDDKDDQYKKDRIPTRTTRTRMMMRTMRATAIKTTRMTKLKMMTAIQQPN